MARNLKQRENREESLGWPSQLRVFTNCFKISSLLYVENNNNGKKKTQKNQTKKQDPKLERASQILTLGCLGCPGVRSAEVSTEQDAEAPSVNAPIAPQEALR